MEFCFISKSAEDTRELGRKFSAVVNGGDVISLSGELGGGKTTFVSGVALALKTKQPVSSPSFTLINIYDCYKDGKEIGIVHCDLYRINKISDISDIGLEDYMFNKKYITFIEWAEKLKEEILKNFVEIRFEYILAEDERTSLTDSENQLRKILFSPADEYWQKKIYLLNKSIEKNENIRN